MHLLLLADLDRKTEGIMHRLTMHGYTVTCLGQVRFVGQPTHKQMRRAVLKAILRCDAVVLLSKEADPMQLARIAVISQYAGVPLLDYGRLPEFAPGDDRALRRRAYRIPVARMPDPPETVRTPSQRLLHGVAAMFIR